MLKHHFPGYGAKGGGGPEEFNDYRPISLVGNLYKLIEKVQAHRKSPCKQAKKGDEQAGQQGSTRLCGGKTDP